MSKYKVSDLEQFMQNFDCHRCGAQWLHSRRTNSTVQYGSRNLLSLNRGQGNAEIKQSNNAWSDGGEMGGNGTADVKFDFSGDVDAFSGSKGTYHESVEDFIDVTWSSSFYLRGFQGVVSLRGVNGRIYTVSTKGAYEYCTHDKSCCLIPIGGLKNAFILISVCNPAASEVQEFYLFLNKGLSDKSKPTLGQVQELLFAYMQAATNATLRGLPDINSCQ